MANERDVGLVLMSKVWSDVREDAIKAMAGNSADNDKDLLPGTIQ